MLNASEHSLRPVLVVGATGYVEARLVVRLLSQGAAARSVSKLETRPWAGNAGLELVTTKVFDRVVCTEDRIRQLIPQDLLCCRQGIQVTLDQAQRNLVQNDRHDRTSFPLPEWIDGSDGIQDFPVALRHPSANEQDHSIPEAAAQFLKSVPEVRVVTGIDDTESGNLVSIQIY